MYGKFTRKEKGNFNVQKSGDEGSLLNFQFFVSWVGLSRTLQFDITRITFSFSVNLYHSLGPGNTGTWDFQMDFQT